MRSSYAIQDIVADDLKVTVQWVGSDNGPRGSGGFYTLRLQTSKTGGYGEPRPVGADITLYVAEREQHRKNLATLRDTFLAAVGQIEETIRKHHPGPSITRDLVTGDGEYLNVAGTGEDYLCQEGFAAYLGRTPEHGETFRFRMVTSKDEIPVETGFVKLTNPRWFQAAPKSIRGSRVDVNGEGTATLRVFRDDVEKLADKVGRTVYAFLVENEED
jgi:hypothetical protein